MKKLFYILIPVALLLVTIIWLKRNKEVAAEKVYHYNKEQPVMVEADTLALRQVAFNREYTGSFEPNRESKVSADVQGKIQRYYVDAGNYVKRGVPLVKLDDDLLQLQLRSVLVQIKGLEADVKRYTVLVAADAIQGVQLEKAQIALQAAQVQRSTILEQIRMTTITAPFDGVVTLKMSEIGAFAAPGVPLLQLTDIYQLRFTVQVPENDLPSFETRQGFRLRADQYPQQPLGGKITLIGSKGNGASLFPVQFLVKNTPDLKIKAGMFGKVEMSTANQQEGILIPSSAIIGSDLQPQVYIVEKGKAVLKPVFLSHRIGNQVLVASGLERGQVLITGGFINLSDGAPVRIK
jgi:membrane fusion protein, multidrug efflux system